VSRRQTSHCNIEGSRRCAGQIAALCRTVVIQRIIGGVFLALAAVAAWCAANPTSELISLPKLEKVGAGPWRTSAICAAFCGAVLLFTAGRRK
jgi:hypothetical protein